MQYTSSVLLRPFHAAWLLSRYIAFALFLLAPCPLLGSRVMAFSLSILFPLQQPILSGCVIFSAFNFLLTCISTRPIKRVYFELPGTILTRNSQWIASLFSSPHPKRELAISFAPCTHNLSVFLRRRCTVSLFFLRLLFHLNLYASNLRAHIWSFAVGLRAC